MYNLTTEESFEFTPVFLEGTRGRFDYHYYKTLRRYVHSALAVRRNAVLLIDNVLKTGRKIFLMSAVGAYSTIFAAIRPGKPLGQSRALNPHSRVAFTQCQVH